MKECDFCLLNWIRKCPFIQVHVYTVGGSNLSPKTELKHGGAITDCAFSPNDEYLVACDTYRKLILYKVPEFQVSDSVSCLDFFTRLFLCIRCFCIPQLAHKKEWGFHNARVNCVAWSPNSLLVASGSLDTAIIIWSVTDPSKHTIIKSKPFYFCNCCNIILNGSF